MQLAHERDDREACLFVAGEQGGRGAGGEVLDIAVVGVADGADALDGFVDAVAGAEGVGAGLISVRSEEGTAVEEPMSLDAGKSECGGGYVEEAEDLIVDLAG